MQITNLNKQTMIDLTNIRLICLVLLLVSYFIMIITTIAGMYTSMSLHFEPRIQVMWT